MNDLFIFSELREARSRLYRRQILQANTLLKATLDEIYKIYRLLHLSAFKNSAKFRQMKEEISSMRKRFSHFCSCVLNISLIFAIPVQNSPSLMIVFRNLSNLYRVDQNLLLKGRFSNFLGVRNEYF